MNQKDIVTRDFTKKESYYVFRKVQDYNGRFIIRVKEEGKSIVSVNVDGLTTSFIEL